MDGSASNALVGTFQQALHRQFSDALSAMLSICLSHMDRNSGLELFDVPELQPLWLYVLPFRHLDTNTMMLVSQELHCSFCLNSCLMTPLFLFS